MTESVLLVNLDKTTYPNLALMHVSTWKKNKGYKVGWDISNPTEIYASCVFSWNRHNGDGLPVFYPNAKINIGGSGIDIHKSLPENVNKTMPDYSLYPDCDYDLGFTTRGCIRNCPFCIVPKKEGKFHIYQHPKEFHDPSHKKIVLMDNNILVDKKWFFTVTDWIIDNSLKVDFNQGLDLRLIDSEVADRLSELKPINRWHFAFDNLNYREYVESGLLLLKKAGVNIRSNANVYVYCDNDSDVDSALMRCQILKKIGTTPYLMINHNAIRTQRMTNLRRWTRPWIFYSCDFESYNNLSSHNQTILDPWM